MIAGLGYSLASFHSVIYESLVAGHAAKPLPLPNAYQDRFLCQPKCTSGGLWIVSVSRSRKPAPIVFHAKYVDALQLLRCYHSFPVDGTFSCVRSPLQDEGIIIPECEWLAGVYGSRRPHGWQGCDEIQDQSGRRERFIQRGLLCPHYLFNHNNVYVRN